MNLFCKNYSATCYKDISTSSYSFCQNLAKLRTIRIQYSLYFTMKNALQRRWNIWSYEKLLNFLLLYSSLTISVCLQSSMPHLATLWLQGMQNENNRQQQATTTTTKTLRRTHFYNSKTQVSPCRAASSCLFIKVFGSCIVLLAMREREKGGGGGKKERKRSVAWHSMPLPAHWVACRARARVNFLSYLLARHLCQGRKVILCCLLSFCCCFSPILLLLFLRSTWNHKCSRCWCHRCRRCWWRLTRPEVVQNLKRKSIVREQAQWPPEPEPEPEAAAAAWPLDAIFGHNDITRSHIHMRAHTHTHTNSHTRHTRYAFFVVFYWVIGAFICHTPHARFMPAMCHVAKTNSCLSVLLSLCPSVRLSFRPASQPDSQ